jgi:hypothetical protein
MSTDRNQIIFSSEASSYHNYNCRLVRPEEGYRFRIHYRQNPTELKKKIKSTV